MNKSGWAATFDPLPKREEGEKRDNKGLPNFYA